MTNNNLNCHCSCGEAQFGVLPEPLMRAFCHCTICQAFNQGPYADITLFRSRDVIMPKKGTVEFTSYKFPPILKRGKCISCGGAAVEYLQTPMPQIIVVPTVNITTKSLVPDPLMHIFYNRRVADIQDTLPKHSGYLKSQLAFGHALTGALLRGSKSA